MQILEQQDAYILTSEFEGMPNALNEAMARGCVPVVTDIRSGIPELVRYGVNGYRVPVGYPRGNFGPVTRLPLDNVSSWNRWGSQR